MAKPFLIISIAFLISLSCSAQRIVVKHISGFSDKPIYTLVFTLKDTLPFFNIDVPITRFINLNDGEFTVLNEFVKNNDTNVRFSKYEPHPYGAFEVQIQRDNENVSYMLKDSLISTVYFSNLVTVLKEYFILNRLDYFEELVNPPKKYMPRLTYWFENIINRIE
jgi:hypothetical protein